MTANSLSDRLRAERKRLDMTQEEIAQKVSIKRETWSRYETDKMLPSTNVLLSAIKFGLDVNYVLTGKKATASNTGKYFKSSVLTSSEDRTAYKLETPLTVKEEKLIRYYREVNKSGKKTIDDIAQLLATQQVK